jgi:photosystem II stability/assembly factor-like uncharacterized protein
MNYNAKAGRMKSVRSIPQAATAILVATLVVRAYGANPPGVPKWTRLGPDGGSISALVIDPQNTDTLYAATGNGVFKSTDGAANWRYASAGLPNRVIITLILDPNNPATLYAALDGEGIFKTTDGGVTWNGARAGIPILYGPTGYGDVVSIAIDRDDSMTLYAGTERGVYKSIDGGANWTESNSGLPVSPSGCYPRCDLFYATAVAIDPQNSNHVFSAGVVTPAGRPSYSAGFHSDDGGATWFGAGSGLPVSWPFLSILLKDRDSETLYTGNYLGVFKSADRGVTWSLVENSPGNASRLMALTIDPGNPGTLYAMFSGPRSGGAGKLVKSTDSGATWIEVGSGLESANFLNMSDTCSCADTNAGMAIDPRNPDTIYLGSMGDGVFKSTDGGATWRAANNGLSARPILSAVILPGNATLYATDGARIYKSQDSGASWTAGAWAAPDHWISTLVMDPQAPDRIYVGTWQVEDSPPGKVYRTEDGGATWSDTNDDRNWSTIWSMAIDPSNPTTVYAGTETGVFKTVDGGGNWAAIGPWGLSEVRSIVVDPQSPATVYALGQFVGTAPVFRSTDGGATWTALTNGLPPCCGVRGLAIDRQNSANLFTGSASGVFKSVDGGATWTRSGLETMFVNSLAVDPQAPDTVYAATPAGVYRSLNAGKSWHLLDGGPPWVVDFLMIDPHDASKVYAATGGGLFRIAFTAQTASARKEGR